jgi:hypothetical protein
MPLVDLSGKALDSESAPSMERGASWLAEALEVGYETAGLGFVGMTHARREQLLGDIQQLMMFLRETWSAMHSYHMAHPAESPTEETDTPNG